MTYPDSLPLPDAAPTYQALMDAHDTYLRELHKLIEHDHPGPRIGDWMPYALFVHVLQLARAVHLLTRDGYADEALPLARSMVSTTMNLLFIVRSGDPHGWSLRYYLQLGEQESRYLEKELTRGRFDQATVRTLIDAAKANVDGAIAAVTDRQETSRSDREKSSRKDRVEPRTGREGSRETPRL